MSKRRKRELLTIIKLIYIAIIILMIFAVLWPRTHEESSELDTSSDNTFDVVLPQIESRTQQSTIEQDIVFETNIQEPLDNILPGYSATRMTHYVMDGNDANTCIAGIWCIDNQLTIADDTSIRYEDYYVYAVHCSVVNEWRGSLVTVYYTDGGVETGIVLDCGGFAGHTDRMDKAMGVRYNGNQDNYTLSRYIERVDVIRKGW